MGRLKKRWKISEKNRFPEVLVNTSRTFLLHKAKGSVVKFLNIFLTCIFPKKSKKCEVAWAQILFTAQIKNSFFSTKLTCQESDIGSEPQRLKIKESKGYSLCHHTSTYSDMLFCY